MSTDFYFFYLLSLMITEITSTKRSQQYLNFPILQSNFNVISLCKMIFFMGYALSINFFYNLFKKKRSLKEVQIMKFCIYVKEILNTWNCKTRQMSKIHNTAWSNTCSTSVVTITNIIEHLTIKNIIPL